MVYSLRSRAIAATHNIKPFFARTVLLGGLAFASIAGCGSKEATLPNENPIRLPAEECQVISSRGLVFENRKGEEIHLPSCFLIKVDGKEYLLRAAANLQRVEVFETDGQSRKIATLRAEQSASFVLNNKGNAITFIGPEKGSIPRRLWNFIKNQWLGLLVGFIIGGGVASSIKESEYSRVSRSNGEAVRDEVLYKFETDLRRFVVSRLEAVFGSDWFKSQVPQDIKNRIEKRQKEDAKKGNKVKDPLDYLSLLDYLNIIIMEANWKKVFVYFFNNVASAQVHLTELAELRNKLYHHQPIEIEDYMKQRDVHIAALQKLMQKTAAN